MCVCVCVCVCVCIQERFISVLTEGLFSFLKTAVLLDLKSHIRITISKKNLKIKFYLGSQNMVSYLKVLNPVLRILF